MIKKIEINYPEFGNGLKINYKFENNLTVIEERNGYGKSVLLKTIMSIYTGKFGTSKVLPEGFASIETDKTKYVLSKKTWIGKDFEDNELYLYTMPGMFHESLDSTPKQRAVLVKLLGLDYVSFMKDKITDNIKGKEDYFKELSTFNDKTEDELKAMLKESLAKDSTILEDIMRLKSKLINKEEKDFTDVLEYRDAVGDIQRQAQDHNRGLFIIQQQHQKLLSDIRTTESSIVQLQNLKSNYDSQLKTLNEQLEGLRSEYTTVQDESKCDKCGSKLSEDKLKVRLDGILSTANKVKDNISNTEIKISDTNKSIESLNKTLSKLKSDLDLFVLPETIDTNNIEECVIKLNLNRIPKLEAGRELEYEEYQRYLNELSFVQSELNIKEQQLKSIDSIRLQNSLDTIKGFKKMFTHFLNDEVKKLPIDIELFKENKDGSIRETFIIKKDGIEYNNLSQGNKSLVNILLSKIFMDKLNFNLLLIDEGSNISKDNLGIIKSLASDYQIIICKPTGWTLKDFK